MSRIATPPSHLKPRSPRRLVRLLVGTVAVGLAAGGVQVHSSGSSAKAAQPPPAYGMWSDKTVPGTAADPDTRRVKVGVRFASATDGWVSAIQFYRAKANVGPHVGQLWTARGKRLATVRFGATRSAGWHTAALSSPVRIRSGRRYVAAYTAPRGRYSADQHALSPRNPTVNRKLKALRGVYTYRKGLPRKTWRNSNYYVDVIFSRRKAAAARAARAATSSTTGSTITRPSGSAPTTTGGGFPNASNTGVPSGWSPVSTRTSDLRVTTAGATVQDIRLVNANLVIDARNVTVRRVEIQGGRVDVRAKSGTVLEQVSLIRAPGQVTGSGGTEAIGPGGYTARNVKIDGLPEGFRVGGKGSGYGPVTIIDSFARIVSPDRCDDWHGDGLQGYDGPAVTIRNMTIDFVERNGCGGTAPFFYPRGQGNTSVDIDGLLVSGGGFSFRNGMPGPVRGLKIVNNSWGYGPLDVLCSATTAWDAQIVTIGSNYQPTSVVRSQPCNTQTGS